MNAPLTEGQVSLFPAGVRTGGLLRRLAGALAYVCDIPRRNAVLGRLVPLSDRELAARGLTRGDLTRVFDADFTGFPRRV